MSWCEIVFEVPRERVEAWSDALLEAGALAVNAEDADADSPDEQPLYGEPGLPPPGQGWERTRLAVLVDAGADPAAILDAAAGAIGADTPGFELQRFEDQDWVQATQAQFEPIEVGRRLLVTPSWSDRPPGERLRLVVDPGLAFGTGSHPTTRLCLEWLDANLRNGENVIDYGCGSGILAIGACLLGAGTVTAIDIDPQAVEATRRNAESNGVRLAARLASGPPPEPSEVVVANILSNPLKLLAPLLVTLVRPGGALVLSGVLERQVDEVASAYRPWLRLECAAAREGWACLAGRMPG